MDPVTVAVVASLAKLSDTVVKDACRPGEALGLRWEEISEDGLWWVIPEARPKNGLAHRVFLTPPSHTVSVGLSPSPLDLGFSRLCALQRGRAPSSSP